MKDQNGKIRCDNALNENKTLLCEPNEENGLNIEEAGGSMNKETISSPFINENVGASQHRNPKKEQSTMGENLYSNTSQSPFFGWFVSYIDSIMLYNLNERHGYRLCSLLLFFLAHISVVCSS